MAGRNLVILVGRLGRDPVFRTMQGGDEVASFSLATSETWKDKASGDRKERTEWHNVVVYAEHAVKYAKQALKKGSQVYIEGQNQTRKYTDKDGAERTITEVVLQRFKGELQGLSDLKSDGADRSTGASGQSRSEPAGKPATEDDIPF